MPDPTHTADARTTRFELHRAEAPLSLDPHLQDSILASSDPAWSPSPTIGCCRDGKVYVDVLARLLTEKEKLRPAPKQIQVLSEIGDIVTGIIAVDEIEDARKGVRSLKAATDLFLDLRYSVAAIQCNPGALQENLPAVPGLDGSGVIIGIVDVGCDFRHRNFRLPSGETRLLYLWDQSNPEKPHDFPQPFGYGRELNSVTINKALQEPDPYGFLGYTPEVGAHGTHVMDIAAGNGREPETLESGPAEAPKPSSPGVAPNALLIFVHLKTDKTGFLGNSRHLLEAVDYIFSKADELRLPAVVNLSLATHGGPHDGTTLVEQGFENLLQQPGRAIVVSAGNAYGKESHVEGTVKRGTPTRLEWWTDPRADRNELEIWYAGDRTLEVNLIAPDKAPLGAVARGMTADIHRDGTRVGRISHRHKDPNNGDNQIDIRVPQPEPGQVEGFTVHGPDCWIIELSTLEDQVPFHAWIEQNDRGMARFGGGATRSCTLGSICCGASTLTVGAYDTSERAALALPLETTAEGPTRNDREKPEVSAPGNGIVAAKAQGGTTLMSGTSMATAHVSGFVALLFQLAQRVGLAPLSIQTTRQIVLGAAQALRSQKKPWDGRLGRGRIDGAKSLKDLDLLALAQQAAPAKEKQRSRPGRKVASAKKKMAVAQAYLGGSAAGNGREDRPNGN